MTTKLKISRSFSLPLAFVTSTNVILGQKRGGKSYKGDVIAEELLATRQQIVIMDPTSAHWGLRSSADGKSPGYPITIFGGEHADLPLESTAGEAIADAIVSERFSAILDLSLFTKGEEQRFCGAFLERLYRKNREAMHLFLDEADVYAPQRPFGEEARTLGACQSIVRRGGIKGIGITMITQRPAVLNKDVLSQCDTLMALRMSHPKDLGAIEDWVAVHGDVKLAKELIASLPALPKGDAWIWSPSRDIFERVTFRDKHTFDSGRTPQAGETIAPPKVLAPVDLERLGESIAATVQRAKDNDPKILRAKIAELVKERDQLSRTAIAAPASPKIIEKSVLRAEDATLLGGRIERGLALVKELDAASTRLHVVADAIASDIAALRTSIADAALPTLGARVAPSLNGRSKYPVRAIFSDGPPPANSSKASGGGKKNGLRRMLTALAQRPAGLTNRQIGLRAGLSSKSGTFSTYLGNARSQGWIEDVGEIRRITKVGIAWLGAYDPLPTGRDLADYWLRQFGDSGAGRILGVLIDAYPDRLPAETIGERAKISHKSGTYSTYVGKLRGLELIEGRGDLGASEELFS